MEVTYKFKLKPNEEQIESLLDWQHKVGYMQNRSLGDRIFAYQSIFVQGECCDLRTRKTITSEAVFCEKTGALVSPLRCSVNKSASLGYPWKTDDPKLRRAKPDKDGKIKKFQPNRSAVEMHSNWLTEFRQQNPGYQSVSFDVLQQALRHVDTAFNKFFFGKAGFPNFKQHKDVSFEFKPKTTRINKRYITFPVLGRMRFFKSREIPETWEVRTVTISRDIDGWYAAVLLRDETVPDIVLKKPEECKTIQGADVGIKKLIALSDGTMIDNPRFQSKSARRLLIRQRRVSRKKRGSSNRRKAAKRLAKVHQKIRRQREDYQWKAGKQTGENADITVFEELNIKGMISRCKPLIDEATGLYLKNGQAAKSGLNKAIADAAWYSLRQKTKHQAAKIGNLVIEVDPKYTSQECSACHYVSAANRDKEKFVCESCGHADDADTNGAKNQAQRGKEKLRIDSLLVVSQKVTPTKPASQEASSVPRDESRNPAKSTVKQRSQCGHEGFPQRASGVQLLLLKVKSTDSQSKSRTKSKRKVPEVQYTQLSLFDSFDRDARKSKTKIS